MAIVFVIFVFLSLYSYAFFPIFLAVSFRIIQRPWSKRSIEPNVSLIISVFNEEKVITEKIENSLTLDYPKEKLEIIVISDGSTDRTEQIVRVFGARDSRIVLKAFRERSGKTECLNRVVPEVKGDIIFFTDANSMFPKDVLAKLVRNFSDECIGLVSGWTKYGADDLTEDTAGVYSRFEKWTKIRESQISSCVGADGAVFAIRKELYKALRHDDINDFVIPLDVVRQGKRVVMDPEIYCFEKSASDVGKEYQRQIRITTRTLNAISRNMEFLNPFRYGFFSLFLMSHKVMRFLVPFFLAGTFVANLIILTRSPMYFIIFMFQLLVITVGIICHLGLIKGKIGSIAKLFMITLLAQTRAWFRVFAGKYDTMWTPQR